MSGLQSIPVPIKVMQQVEINLCNLPEVDEFKPFIAYIISLNDLKQNLSLINLHQLLQFFVPGNLPP